MSSNSQLFQIQDCLKKNRKPLRQHKSGKKTEMEEKAAGVSMGFYDDLSPIQLSGGLTYQFNQHVFQEGESFAQTITEDATFSIVDENENTAGGRSSDADVVTFEQSGSENILGYTHQQDEDGLLNLTGKGEGTDSPLTLSDAEIAGDLSAILSTTVEQKNLFTSQEKEEDDFYKKILEKNKEQASATPADETPASPAQDTNKNIFDAIAKSLNYANAFDLGDYVLEQRFDMFDDEENKKAAQETKTEKVITPEDNTAGGLSALNEHAEGLSTKYFVEDLDIIQETARSLNVTVDKTTKSWPSAPSDLLQPSSERTKQLFGEFEFEDVAGSASCEIKIKGNWASTNIEEIDIPQLNGKLNGTTNKEITKGIIKFNKKAKKQLQKLWKAWEDANLLDRIITYDGGFVPRHIKKKGGGCAISLSNHAWGSAFDINADWNGLGAEPALAGQKGSVRELVEIANKHGFYWGGHYGTKDGMHFEVAKIIEYTD
jgi:hypothetical protein